MLTGSQNRRKSLLTNCPNYVETVQKGFIMKKIITLLLILFLLGCNNTQILEEPKVDNRVELLSVVFRLAELREYNVERFKLYTDKIKQHFEPYKNHELIEFAKELRHTNGVSFDAVMRMAVYLDDDLNPRVDFSDTIPEKRWGKENAIKFNKLLKEFYTDANCKEFFDENKGLYSEAESRFLQIYKQIDLEWFSSFFGNPPNETFKIIPGLGNGVQSYGPSVNLEDNKREVYAIVGAWRTDDLGMVIFPEKEYFPNLLHEFNHSFVNHLVDDNIKALEESGKKLFEEVKSEMNNQNYGHWTTVMYETLVRASVIKYMKDHNYPQIDVAIETNRQLCRGFLWLEDVLDEIEKYDNKRIEYPTLESYMPTLISAFQTYPEKIDIYREKIEARRPKVVSIDEFSNGDRNVPSSLRSVTINFDRRLHSQGISINMGENDEPYPDFNIEELRFSEDQKSIILGWELKENTPYVFVLVYMESFDGASMNDYKISFKTE